MKISAQKSTIVRIYRRARFASTRLAFRALERTAPGLGARWGVRMWFSPPRVSSRLVEPSGGEPIRVSVHGRSVIGTRWPARIADGARSAGDTADGRSPDPLVYLLHGWGGERRQLAEFVEPLRRAGYGVLAFDALAHGESGPGLHGPGQTTLGEFADALELVAAEHGQPYGVVAHSGAAVGCTIAIEEGLPVGRLVFVAPLTDPLMFVRRHPIGFGRRTRVEMLELATRRIRQPMSDFDLLEKSRNLGDRLPPLLVIHDHQDREVEVADSERLVREWPGAKLHDTHGLGHGRILRDPGVIETAVGWLVDGGVVRT